MGHNTIRAARNELHEKGWIKYVRMGVSRKGGGEGCSFVIACSREKWIENRNLFKLPIDLRYAPPETMQPEWAEVDTLTNDGDKSVSDFAKRADKIQHELFEESR